MPTFRITTPNGEEYEIDAPEGASEDQALAFFQKSYTPQQAAESKPVQQYTPPNVADDIGWGQAGLIGAGKTFSRIGQGLEQGYYGLIGDEPAQAALKQQVEEENSLYKPLQDAHPIATTIGESLPSMAVPGGAGLKSMMAAGAIPGLFEYGDTGERLGRGAMGAAGAGLGVGFMNVLGRLNKPFTAVEDPVRQELVDVFSREGIPMSAANESGNNSLKWIDSALDNLPWVADKQLAAKTAQKDAFNQAIGRTFGADEPALTPDVLNAAKQKLGAGFSDLSERNRLNFTDKQLNDVAQVKFDLERYGTEQNQRIIGNYLDDLLTKVEPDGTISGQAYRQFDSSLGKRMRGTSDGDLRHYLGEVRGMVRGAMDDSISAVDQEAWRDLRRQYANLQTVADSVKASPTGDVSPAGLLQRVNNQSKSAKFTGGGDLGELARAGKEILSPLPDSGTAQRKWRK
ncbi:MAG: hypothetical protein WC505_07980, partial [Patescibacteria group bacterium]